MWLKLNIGYYLGVFAVWHIPSILFASTCPVKIRKENKWNSLRGMRCSLGFQIINLARPPESRESPTLTFSLVRHCPGEKCQHCTNDFIPIRSHPSWHLLHPTRILRPSKPSSPWLLLQIFEEQPVAKIYLKSILWIKIYLKRQPMTKNIWKAAYDPKIFEIRPKYSK